MTKIFLEELGYIIRSPKLYVEWTKFHSPLVPDILATLHEKGAHRKNITDYYIIEIEVNTTDESVRRKREQYDFQDQWEVTVLDLRQLDDNPTIKDIWRLLEDKI
jgi:hypothetical protein